jgi:hypothetical protein
MPAVGWWLVEGDEMEEDMKDQGKISKKAEARKKVSRLRQTADEVMRELGDCAKSQEELEQQLLGHPEYYWSSMVGCAAFIFDYLSKSEAHRDVVIKALAELFQQNKRIVAMFGGYQIETNNIRVRLDLIEAGLNELRGLWK